MEHALGLIMGHLDGGRGAGLKAGWLMVGGSVAIVVADGMRSGWLM